MSFPTSHEGEKAVYTGHDVVDEQGQRIGKVIDVIYDDAAASLAAAAAGPSERGRQPSWLVVDPGVLRSPHYLPVAGSYRTGDGTIVTPWDRDWVRSAAKVGHGHVMTREQREELLAHYSLPG